MTNQIGQVQLGRIGGRVMPLQMESIPSMVSGILSRRSKTIGTIQFARRSIGLAFDKLFGVRVGYNLFATLVIYSTSWSMDKLVQIVGVGFLPAIFAGIAMETSSFLLLEVEHGRLSQALLLFWLLGLSAFIQMARGKANWWLTIGAGIALSCTALTYWYWALFLVFACIPVWIGEFWFWDK